jgi:AmmeMemoRadiSam system protein B
MPHVRPPAVAGSFYPSDPERLRALVQDLLRNAPSAGAPPKALVVPHAGYGYSGPVAASGFARLAAARDHVRRVVLLGPAHRVAFEGMAVPTARAFATPLGEVSLDRAGIASLGDVPGVLEWDAPHAQEHSLEVELPFLQEVLGEFTLVPVVVGETPAKEVEGLLERLWDGAATVVVVSSDLSHYLDHGSARRMDAATTEAIRGLRAEALDGEAACGCFPLRGLLALARRRGLTVEVLDVRNSGDTAGGRDRVVGYGAYAFH